MNGLVTVELKNLRFHALHGVDPLEQKSGADFEVNVMLVYEAKSYINSIEDTINYVTVYEIVQKEMKQPRKLLETVAMDITNKLKSSFIAERVSVQIIKLTPPICNFAGSVGVSFVWSKNENI